MSQTTFPSLRNDAQVATDSGSIEMPAPLESASRCIPRSGLVQCRLCLQRHSRHTFCTRIAEIINRSDAEPGYAEGVKNYVAGWADGSKQHVVYERQLAEADAAEFTKLLHAELYKEEVR